MRMYAAVTTGIMIALASVIGLWTLTCSDVLEIAILAAIAGVCSWVTFMAATEEKG